MSRIRDTQLLAAELTPYLHWNNMNWDAISAIASSVSAILAGIAIWISAWVSFRLHQEQIRHNRRQSLLPVWKEMAELSRVDPRDPDNEVFRVSLNLLLLIAQIAEQEIVELHVLREMFSTAYIKVYKDIEATALPVTIDGQTKAGRDYLVDSPRLKKWYDTWATTK